MDASLSSQQKLVADPAASSPLAIESLTSSLITPYPFHVDRLTWKAPITSPPAFSHDHRELASSWTALAEGTKYPSPFDRYFEQLDMWKLLAVLVAMITGIATLGNYKFIPKECMHDLVLMLIIAFFFLTVAYKLQDMVPEIAVGTMLTGIALVIACFHAVGLSILDLPDKQRYLVISVLVVGYIVLFSLILHKLFKDDVREKEETEDVAEAHIAMV